MTYTKKRLFSDSDPDSNVGTYKSYVATWSQSTTAAPEFTVLHNDLGGSIVWSRTGIGIYKGHQAESLMQNSVVFVTIDPAGSMCNAYPGGTDLYLYKFDFDGTPSDGVTYGSIEIRVYP